MRDTDAVLNCAATMENCSKAIAENFFDRSSYWCIYGEIKELLRFYPDIFIRKVDHECNKVAHNLAQLGKRESSRVLRESAPTCVLTVIANDCKILLSN
jgi:hypothetical protein